MQFVFRTNSTNYYCHPPNTKSFRKPPTILVFRAPFNLSTAANILSFPFICIRCIGVLHVLIYSGFRSHCKPTLFWMSIKERTERNKKKNGLALKNE